MATRNVTFNFAPDPNTLDLLDHFSMTVALGGVTQLTVPSIAKTATSYATALAVGTGYTATLYAYNASGQPDANPPSIAFDVPPPPPTVPGDPTFTGAPTIS